MMQIRRADFMREKLRLKTDLIRKLRTEYYGIRIIIKFPISTKCIRIIERRNRKRELQDLYFIPIRTEHTADIWNSTITDTEVIPTRGINFLWIPSALKIKYLFEKQR